MKNRNYEIDFWKFIFSICIVIYHAWQFQYPGETIIFRYGNLLVDFFFVVSGFLMVLKIYNKKKPLNIGKDTWNFIIYKLKPIYKYILLAFIFGLVLKIIFLPHNIFYYSNSIFEVLQIQMWGILNTNQLYQTVNSAAWYISAMLFVFLIIYPLAVKYKKTFTTLIAPISIFVLCFYITANDIYIYDPFTITNFIPNGLIRAFLSMNIGCTIYELVLLLKKIKFNTFSKILFTFFEVLIIIMTFIFAQNGFLNFSNLIIPFAFGIFVLIIFSENSYIGKLFTNKVWQFFSKFGFVMYLNNVYIRDILKVGTLQNYEYNLFRLMFLCIIISMVSLLIIYISEKIIEKK